MERRGGRGGGGGGVCGVYRPGEVYLSLGCMTSQQHTKFISETDLPHCDRTRIKLSSLSRNKYTDIGSDSRSTDSITQGVL